MRVLGERVFVKTPPLSHSQSWIYQAYRKCAPSQIIYSPRLLPLTLPIAVRYFYISFSLLGCPALGNCLDDWIGILDNNFAFCSVC